MESKAYNMDCMEGMKQYPDKYFDLAVVDPPYGGGADDNEYRGAIVGRFGGRFDKYHLGQPGERERENAADKGIADRRDVGRKVQPKRGCL